MNFKRIFAALSVASLAACASTERAPPPLPIPLYVIDGVVYQPNGQAISNATVLPFRMNVGLKSRAVPSGFNSIECKADGIRLTTFHFGHREDLFMPLVNIRAVAVEGERWLSFAYAPDHQENFDPQQLSYEVRLSFMTDPIALHKPPRYCVVDPMNPEFRHR